MAGGIVFVLGAGMTAQAFLIPQIRALLNAGAAVQVACGRDAWSATLARATGCVVHELDIDRRATGWRDARAFAQLLRLLRREAPSTVIGSTPKGLLYGMTAARLAGVPRRIAYYRGLVAATAQGGTQRLALVAEWAAARCAGEHVAVSESLLREARLRRVLRPTQGLVIGNGMSRGIDAAGLRATAAASGPVPSRGVPGRRYLWLGRCARRKGFDTLASAWPTIRDTLPGSSLTVVGALDVHDKPDVESVMSMERDPTVRWTGQAAEVAPWIAACDVLLFPSAGEGFPNAPMEAAAFEVPTIGFDVMGVRDAVHHGDTGVLVTERSPAAFASAAIALGRDPESRHRLGTAARQRVEAHYSEEQVTRAHVAHFLGSAPGRHSEASRP